MDSALRCGVRALRRAAGQFAGLTATATRTTTTARKGHSGTTWTATVVPRTPTIAEGVSRRTESGASFAI